MLTPAPAPTYLHACTHTRTLRYQVKLGCQVGGDPPASPWAVVPVDGAVHKARVEVQGGG